MYRHRRATLAMRIVSALHTDPIPCGQYPYAVCIRLACFTTAARLLKRPPLYCADTVRMRTVSAQSASRVRTIGRETRAVDGALADRVLVGLTFGGR